MSLPNPGMSFTPFDPLPASDMNDIVENIEALAAGTGLNDSAIVNAKIAANNLYASKIFIPYKFHATRTSQQTPGANTFTKMQMNVEQYDTGSNYDAVTNFRFTAPVNGFYTFCGRTSIGGGANGRAVQCLYKNGVILSRGDDTSHASNPIGGCVVDQIQLTAGDYIEYYIFSVNAIATEVGNDISMFSGRLISST